MNTGQSFLSLGAMSLVALIVLNVNTGFVMTSTTLLENKLNILAISLGSSVIEEASGLAFDANTVVNSASMVSDLTYPGSLGCSSAESYPNFNDFDDFNGLNFTTTMSSSAEFNVTSKVEYVNPNSESIVYVNLLGNFPGQGTSSIRFADGRVYRSSCKAQIAE